MSISNTTETALLSLVFTATTWANYAINATTTPETTIAVALHSADPADGGTMATSEIVYTSYLRLTGASGVARSTGGWAVANGSCSPVANIDFAASTGGAATTASFFSTGKSGGGAAAILWSGSLVPPISIQAGVLPRLTVNTTLTLDAKWFASLAAIWLTLQYFATGLGAI